MKIFVVIVTFNGIKWTKKCFDNIRNSSVTLNTIVIDNGSADGTTDLIKQYYPEVDLIESEFNSGFAAANNIGIKKALANGADFIFLLNQDAWIEPNTIEVLIEVAKKKPEYGILSPIHLNGSGDLFDKNFYNYISSEGRSLFSDVFNGITEDVYNYSFVNAAAWLISRRCIEKIGGFDSKFFPHYGEDNNYIQRITFQGFKLGVVPESIIYHDREARGDIKIDKRFQKAADLRSFKLNCCDPKQSNLYKLATILILTDIKKCIRQFLKFNFVESRVILQSAFYKIKLLSVLAKKKKQYSSVYWE